MKKLKAAANTPVCDTMYDSDGDWFYCESDFCDNYFSLRIKIQVPNYILNA
jgi:hypothetical protein